MQHACFCRIFNDGIFADAIFYSIIIFPAASQLDKFEALG